MKNIRKGIKILLLTAILALTLSATSAFAAGQWADTPTTGQWADIPTDQVTDTPYTDQESETPEPIEQETETTPTTDQWAETPTTGQWSTPTTDQWAETPTTDQWAETPTTDQWAETPTTDQWAETPTTDQWAETPTTDQWAETPTTDQWTETPATDPWTETPAIDPWDTQIPVVEVPELILLTFDVPPRVENGRTLVPLRKIFEVLGAEVIWDPATQQITAIKGTIIVKLKINSKIAYVNKNVVTLEVPAKIVQGRTLVPLRFVSEALGSKVDYDALTKKVTIANKYYFYLGSQNQNQSNTGTSNDDYFTKHKAFFGKWNVWVSGGFTAPDPVTGISTYTKGAAGGTLNIDQYGTFVWDMKTTVYKGVWGAHPTSPGNLILKSTDGWDYTLTMVDSKTIKWYSYGIEYYGTRD